MSACCFEIDAGALRQRLQQQPAFVERAAGHAELLALEIADAAIGECSGTMTAPSVLEYG